MQQVSAMGLSHHAAVELSSKKDTDREKKGRWRMNTSLLRDETCNL